MVRNLWTLFITNFSILACLLLFEGNLLGEHPISIWASHLSQEDGLDDIIGDDNLEEGNKIGREFPNSSRAYRLL